MREIKFRAWDTKTKKMDYEPHIYGCETSCVEYDEVNLNKALARGGDADCGDSRIFEQYTGLKDINGVDICEGDILEDGEGDPIVYYVVKFERGKFIGSTQGVDEDIFELTDLEVIGNIHENKDLLGDINVTNMEEEE